jgi:hypothetical protein
LFPPATIARDATIEKYRYHSVFFTPRRKEKIHSLLFLATFASWRLCVKKIISRSLCTRKYPALRFLAFLAGETNNGACFRRALREARRVG